MRNETIIAQAAPPPGSGYAEEGNAIEEAVTENVFVVREINMFFDWFNELVWYEQIGVAVGIIIGIWLFVKIIGAIFSSGH